MAPALVRAAREALRLGKHCLQATDEASTCVFCERLQYRCCRSARTSWGALIESGPAHLMRYFPSRNYRTLSPPLSSAYLMSNVNRPAGCGKNGPTGGVGSRCKFQILCSQCTTTAVLPLCSCDDQPSRCSGAAPGPARCSWSNGRP